MAIPSTGSVSMSQINAEFGRGLNLNAYRGTTYYTSSGGPFTFPSGSISMNDFRGTQASGPVAVAITGMISTYYSTYDGVLPVDCVLTFYPDGYWQVDYSPSGIDGATWYTPNTASLGSNYWIKFTRTAIGGSNGFATNTTGWLNLSSNQLIRVSKNILTGTYTATYTIQISSSSSGSPVLSSTSVTLQSTI